MALPVLYLGQYVPLEQNIAHPWYKPLSPPIKCKWDEERLVQKWHIIWSIKSGPHVSSRVRSWPSGTGINSFAFWQSDDFLHLKHTEALRFLQNPLGAEKRELYLFFTLVEFLCPRQTSQVKRRGAPPTCCCEAEIQQQSNCHAPPQCCSTLQIT